MKTESHQLWGHYMVRHYFRQESPVERSAFLLGCAEPDWNLSTYFRGTLKVHAMKGHNYPNSDPVIRTLCTHLEENPPTGWLYYYRLGKLTHYLLDAFTWPHNTTYSGGLVAHAVYERQLKQVFSQVMATVSRMAVPRRHHSLYEWFRMEHQVYLGTPPGPETDSRFALRVTKTALFWLLAEAAAPVPDAPILLKGMI